MSLSPPRASVNGINATNEANGANGIDATDGANGTDATNGANGAAPERNYQLYWCYHCHQSVWISPTDPPGIVCPQCLGWFVCEMEINRPRMVVNFTAFDPSPEAGLLEALSLLMDPPIRLFDLGNSDNQEPRGGPWLRRCRNNLPESEGENRPQEPLRRRGSHSSDGTNGREQELEPLHRP